MKREIKGTTRVCGLIGDPVHHTLSPTIHNGIADEQMTNLVYVPFEVKGDKLGEAIEGAKALDILGLNVTIPHKNAVIPFLDEIDPVAEHIGAVNTLVRTESGTGFKGYNTDYYGIKRSLERALVSLKDESVIILGAGGVSRPCAFLCAREGAREVFILNRTILNARNLCDAVNDSVGRELCKALSLSDYDKLPKDRQYICFQMTSVGLIPDTDSAVIEDPEFYKLLHTGFDAVYRPLKTRFLRECEKAGAKCIDGLRLLLYQGVYAYELWVGMPVSEQLSERIYGRLLGGLLDGENIILTGFMGCGKSAVSEALADMLGYALLDSDSMIEDQLGKRISDIFAQSGEEYFRDIETSVVKSLSTSGLRGAVLAVGGGLPIRSENRSHLRRFGKVVYLKAQPETVYERVKNDTSRPLLKTDNVMETIRDLQEKRREFYEDGADITVDTDGKSVREIAEEITEALLS